MRTVRGRSPARKSSAITDGTVFTIVMPAASPSRASASASATTCTAPPTASGVKSSSTEMSNEIDVQPSASARSSRSSARAVHSTNVTTPSCSTRTPLGVPVDPDV